METITTMRVNENGNVNVETLKNSDNMENQAGTISKNEVLENARKILIGNCNNNILFSFANNLLFLCRFFHLPKLY